MDISALRSFDEVCRRGSISAAADALGYTQSAVSRQIATLETRMGAALVARHARGVRPTPAGEVLLAHATVVLRTLERAATEVSAAARQPVLHLRVGAVPSAAAILLPRAITAFTAEHPTVRTGFTEDVTPALLPRLLDGALDVAVVSDYPPGLPAQSSLSIAPLMEDTLWCALPAGHRLAGSGWPSGVARAPVPRPAHRAERAPTPDAGRPGAATLSRALPGPAGPPEPLRLEELADESWVEDYAGAASLLTVACAKAGFTPRIDFECGGWLSKQAFVAAGAGVMLVPGLLRPALRPGLVLRPLHDPPGRTLYTATRRAARERGAAGPHRPAGRGDDHAAATADFVRALHDAA